LAFFAEFLQTTGLFKSWVDSCPLNYTSPNAPTQFDVLGTWLLGILAGHNRYSHITGLRGDRVSPQILGMNKIMQAFVDYVAARITKKLPACLIDDQLKFDG